MADNTTSLNKEVPSSTAKRVSKHGVSGQRAEQFKKDFSPELILTFPGLLGLVIKSHKDADEGDN